MKIAIYLGNATGFVGGGTTLPNFIMQGLLSGEYFKRDQVTIVSWNETPSRTNQTAFKYLKLTGFKSGLMRLKIVILAIRNIVRIIIHGADSIESPLEYSLLARLIDSQKFDLIWSVIPSNCSFETPYITSLWDIEHRNLPFYPEVSLNGEWQRREFAYTRSLQRAATIITGTEVGKLQLMHVYGISSRGISVNPFPALGPRDSKKVHRNANTFIYPAQLWPHKNHINLLRGFSIFLSQSTKDFFLYLIGGDKGNQLHIQKEINALGISENVIVTGFIEEKILYQFYSESTFMIYPSLFGPDNLPPLEALSFGCPVAVSDSPGAREQFGDSVHFFDPLNVVEIAKTIEMGFLDQFCNSINARTRDKLLSVKTLHNYLTGVERAVDSLRPHLANWPSRSD